MADRSWLEWPFLDQAHRELHDGLVAWCAGREFLHEGDVDTACRQWVADLGEGGWLRHTVPARWGGTDDHLDVRSLAICRQVLAYHGALADFSFGMQGLGSGAITLFGNEDQKHAWLPGVAAGKTIPAFALSEAEAGSDVAALATTATQDGGEFVLDGGKTWISNGGIADYYVVFARTGPESGARGLSAFVVEADRPGFEVSERIDTISPHPLGTLSFTDCRVPAANLVGQPGEGFRIAMATLDVFRTTVAAAALGFARRALDEALSHTARRELFGAPLADLQMTQASIAEMATDIDASALLVYRSAWAADRGQGRVSQEVAMAKLFATEAAQRIIDRAVQLFGGHGVTSGHIAERLYRDIRALRIYEGASEIQKVIIARQTYRDHST